MKYYMIILLLISFHISALQIEDTTEKTNKVKKQENKPSDKEKVKTETIKNEENNKITDIIMPKAENYGRVFIIPSLSANSVFSKTGNFITINSDFEFNTGLLFNKLAIYGNTGLGNIETKYFLINLEGGIKYNFPRLTRFMKPFLKLGISLTPYFTADYVYMPVTLTSGIGFKFFITDNFAFEESQSVKIGNEVNKGNFYLILRFKLGIIFIF